MLRAPYRLALLGLLAAACGDGAATTNSKTPDAEATGGAVADSGTGGAPVTPDAARPDAAQPDAAQPDAAVPDAAVPDAVAPDAAPDMAVIPPDMAIPDAAIPDAYAPTPLDAGVECQPDAPESPCQPYSRCIDGFCHADLSPNTYRMISAVVVQPETAAEALSGVLALALQGNQINLLIEAGGYTDQGYRVNVGNGRPIVAGSPDSGWVFNHTLPIQNVYGSWVNDHGWPRFEQDGMGNFIIFAPGQPVMTPNGNAFCWNEITTTVHVTVEPHIDADGVVFVHASAVGYMTREAAEAVVFYPTPELPVPLSNALVNEPLVDADLDGAADEYRFDIQIDAYPIPLMDANQARSPDTIPEEPAECNQNP